MASQSTPVTLIAGSLLNGSTSVYYTVPVLSNVTVTQCVVTNADTISHVVSVYWAASQSPGSAKDLVWTGVLAPGQAWSVYQLLNQTMSAGQTIQAQADADSVVNLKASGNLIQ